MNTISNIKEDIDCFVWGSVWLSIENSLWNSVYDSVWYSVYDSVYKSVNGSVSVSVWDSVDNIDLNIQNKLNEYDF